ncbi:MAG TPA: c-type cytochrome domain-containing protein [Flavisolibacter sp.]|nr:c-type cytochrome domain-containing protein [Flavisolibacter sp.]
MYLSITEFIGRFHPLLVHLPIGILLTGLFLQWLSAKEKYKVSAEVIKIILLAGMLSAIITCITGYMLSLSGEYDSKLVSWHMWMGIGVAIASALLFVKVVSQRFDISHKVASAALLGLIIITGHLGGSLTHGSDYLISGLLDSGDTVVINQKPIADIREARVYADIIQPVLQTKCYSCHGKHKQKGELRMDDSLFLMKGGKDGEVIIRGNADKSEMIKRLVLPQETDHHMPPREKPQLSDRQIALIHWWIDGGADFTKRVKELQQPEKIKPALMALQSNNQEHKMPSIIPLKEVEAGDKKAISALKDKGVVILPVSQGSNYLLADFVTASGFSDQDMQLLLPVKKQLLWLKIGNTKITDKALSVIAQCKNIMQLDLTNTKISDKGLQALKALDSLQMLTLVNTSISSTGLSNLTNQKKLQTIYLYHTSVKHDDLSKLHILFPKTVLDTGGYKIPFLNTDTMIVKPAKKINK